MRGASLTEGVDLVTQVCNQIPLQTVEVDHEDGYVETDWVELRLFDIGWNLSYYRRNTVSSFTCFKWE